MQGSGLFEDRSVNQIQGVTYLNEMSHPGGAFYLYPEGSGSEVVVVPARKNVGLVVDGCRVAHGVSRFGPSAAPLPLSRYVLVLFLVLLMVSFMFLCVFPLQDPESRGYSFLPLFFLHLC